MLHFKRRNADTSWPNQMLSNNLQFTRSNACANQTGYFFKGSMLYSWINHPPLEEQHASLEIFEEEEERVICDELELLDAWS